MKQLLIYRRSSCRYFNLSLVIFIAGAMTIHLSADEIVYSNVQTQTNHAVLSTNMVWDDLQIVGGGILTDLDVIVLNFDTSGPRGFTGTIEFRLFDNPNGGPVGTLLGSLQVDQSEAAIPPGVRTMVSLESLAGHGIFLPADERIAVGLQFDQSQWAHAVYNPPTIGSSEDRHWIGDNPVPYEPSYSGSFAWQLTVPEPTSLGLLIAGALVLRRRTWP